ncbi:MAG: Uncharacterized protein XE11_2647 [Methanomicrobiales archaeon 53_19]|jgi:hypothetical protein|nr:MAG: Uncharacterized protein XE11_2647 [Methanomicrobiales archaeon 53_19]HIH85375.1 hypothetical protein [Methanoculleus sp.]
MKPEKTGVVLLGLLLMVSMVVSSAIAQDISPRNDLLGDQNQACVSCSIPENGATFSYESGSEINLLREFGLDGPKSSDGVPPLKSYSDCEGLVDEIMEKAKLTDDADAIIGLYDLERYQILLISRGDLVLEVVYDGESVTMYDIVPELLGETRVSYSPEQVSLREPITTEGSFTTEMVTRLYSVPIRSPDPAIVMADQYMVTVSRTDEYKTNLVVRARLVTEGDFYVNYGQSVSGIVDRTTWSVYTLWSKCEFSSSSSGVGSTSGQVNGHLKVGLLFNRAQMDAWVSCNAWLTTNGGGSQNEWLSIEDDGCS